MPTSLRFLDLSLNHLNNIPEAIADLRNLEVLRLSRNKIKKVENLPVDSLINLDLSNNKITSVDEEITQCIHLTKLNLAKNEIQRVDESIRNLDHLNDLNLDNNQIQKLPDSIDKLFQLELLFISNNKLSVFPKRLYSLFNLEGLHANGNNFGQLLPGIGVLKNLKHLHLYKAGLLFFPSDVSELLSLEVLEMGFNPIKKLPDFTKMSSLKYLGLSGLNNLESPDDQISKLVGLNSLSQLSLTRTPLKTLPASLKENKNLKRIDLGNPSWSLEERDRLKEIFKPIYLWFNK